MIRGAVAGVVGLGLIGGAGSVVYDDSGTATVTIKDRNNGTEQRVRLFGDSGGKTFSCPASTEDKLSPHDIRAGRITLTLRQVRRQKRRLERRYPGEHAPRAVIDRYDTLHRRDIRLVKAYNAEIDAHNAILEADCD
jgi:hypothetical protein